MKRWPFIALLVILIPVGHAEAKTYRSNMITTGFGWCMIKAGGGIGCSSPAIPAVTDGYAYLYRRGRTHYGDTGDLISPSWVQPTNPPRLGKRDYWIKRGIVCYRYRGIECWNKGRHGFVLTRRHYRDF